MHKIELGHSVVATGHHAGRYEIQESALHKDEHDLLQGLSPRKRTEWLASRDLLYQIAGLPERVQCLYDDFGKPYLKGVAKFISVSHSELWCAAMISDFPCGVDIQLYTDTVKRISDRFLTPADLVKAEKHTNPMAFMHVLWGAKECLYKAYGKRKIAFKEHIFIPFLDWENNKGSGEIIYEDIHLFYDIQFRLLPEAAWVYCFERPGAVTSSDWKLQ
ncbi:MAG TPA: 4'-phosphopantetheinyl transferase superfamily protein [Saprospiraceae bacterium]